MVLCLPLIVIIVVCVSPCTFSDQMELCALMLFFSVQLFFHNALVIANKIKTQDQTDADKDKFASLHQTHHTLVE